MHENSELTNHDCFANVFRERGFRKFSTAQTGKLLQEKVSQLLAWEHPA